ncbi:hypothetical protein KAJ27_01765 [bacterium]|nr:hypothetical protein [bacterium]
MIKLKKVYIDKILDKRTFEKFDLDRFKYEFISNDDLQDFEKDLTYITAKDYVFLTEKREGFAKPCPGTKNYICCNYAVINSQEGCYLNCSYCILQGYLKKKIPRIFTNIKDILDDTKKFLEQYSYRRIGTGELSDSLVYDHITRFSIDYIDFFRSWPKVIFEFKTKTVNIENLMNIKEVPENAMVSWSVNTNKIIESEEFRAPSLITRLEAARELQEKGYKIGFHFDPVFLYKNAENEYLSVIDTIFKYVKPSRIGYISIGCFRYLPSMKDSILGNFKNTNIFMGEFFKGIDGKMRYFRPLREKLIKKIVKRLLDYSPDLNLYFCMESSTWWKNILGCNVCNNDEAQFQIDSKL